VAAPWLPVRSFLSLVKEVIVGSGSLTRIFSIVVDNVGHGGITVHDVGLHADGANGQRVSVRRLRERVSRCRAPISRTESMASRITQRGRWMARTPHNLPPPYPIWSLGI